MKISIVYLVLIVIHFNELECSLAKWTKIQQFVQKSTHPQLDEWLRVRKSISLNNVSATCQSSITSYIGRLSKRETAAFKVFDSSAKSDPNFLSFKFANFGHYDICVAQSDFQYCNLRMHLPLQDTVEFGDAIDMTKTSMANSWFADQIADISSVFYLDPITLGVCVPKGCTNEEYNQLIEQITKTTSKAAFIKSELDCVDQPTANYYLTSYPMIKKVSLSIILAIPGLVLLWTGLRACFPGLQNKIMDEIDIYTNMIALLRPSKSELAKKFAIFNIFRYSIFVFAIVAHMGCTASANTRITHISMLAIFIKKVNLFPINPGKHLPSMTSIQFLMSGSLSMSHWNAVLVKSNGKLSFSKYAVLRYLRPLPIVLLTIMCIFAFPSEGFGSGPVFRSTFNNITGNCITTGWTDIFSLSSFMSAPTICLHHGWQISADFQLYLLFFVVLMTMYRNPKLGYRIVDFGIVLSSILNYVVTYKNGTMALLNPRADLRQMLLDFGPLHFNFINGMTAYLFGLRLGHAIVTNKKRIDQKYRLMAWMVSAAIGYMIMCIVVDLELPFFVLCWFVPINRILYSVAMSIFTYLLSQGEFPLLNKAALWYPLQLAGRLSFSTFMIHYLIVWYYIAQLRSPVGFNRDYIASFMIVCGVLVLSHILGFLVYILFEAPLTNFLKTMLVSNITLSTRKKDENFNNNKKGF